MKTCKCCGQAKSLASFYRNKRSPGGYQARCKACHGLSYNSAAAVARVAQWRKDNPQKLALQRKKQNRNYRAKCREVLAASKAGVGCMDCGEIRDKMDWDHRPGTVKLFNPGRFEGRSIPALLAEVAKCDLRCASCHQKRHAAVRRAERLAA